MALYLAVLGGTLVRLLVPVYILNPGLAPAVPFNLALGTVLMLFFLPFLWWRTTVGYVWAAIAGIITVATQPGALFLVADGTMGGESLLLTIPNIVFALLLIGSSVLAWREG